MREDSLISVIMSAYKEEKEWLIEAIESIINQTYCNIEFIIILDNPMNYELKNIIINYSKLDQRIKYFINEKNIGLVESLNKGLRIANGQYIARMDADDISSLNRLDKQKKYLEEHDLDFVGSNVLNFDSFGNEFQSDYPTNYNQILSFSNYLNPMAHPTWFLKKEVFDIVGNYRHIYANEDYDFILRCIIKKIRIGNVEEILLKYRLSPNSISRSNVFEQQIITYYLSRNKNKINNLSEIDINKYVNSFSKKRKEKFLMAQEFAYLSLKNKRKYYLFIYYKIKAIFTSNLYFRINYLTKFTRRLKKWIKSNNI